MEKPKKIHVIGPSGTGKTTLAENLAKLIDSPVYKLDEVVYAFGHRKTDLEIETEIKKLTDKKEWVMEGIHISDWTNKIFESADHIVWMDFPLHVNVTRVTKRYLKQKITGQDKWGFISFLKLVSGTIGYSVRRASETSKDDGDVTPAILETVFSSYKNKLIRVRNNKDYQNYLESFK